MYLFFDTETAGLPTRYNASPYDTEAWPRMIQIAWAVYVADGDEIVEQEHIIKPEGFVIPDDAAEIHGISTERAMEEGKALDFVLDTFLEDLESVTHLVAHNISFDEPVVAAEYIRRGQENPFRGKKKICTMKRSTNHCKISGPYGYKWPTLSELHRHLFGRDFEGAHDAGYDLRAMVRCYRELKRRGVV
jgi:DNA polymerase III subunit epsilon